MAFGFLYELVTGNRVRHWASPYVLIVDGPDNTRGTLDGSKICSVFPLAAWLVGYALIPMVRCIFWYCAMRKCHKVGNKDYAVPQLQRQQPTVDSPDSRALSQLRAV